MESEALAAVTSHSVVASYRAAQAFALTPLTVGVGLVLAVVVAGAAVGCRHRRNAAGGGVPVDVGAVELVPPSEASPGELGTVLHGAARYEQVSATVLDLVRRGHLHLTPNEVVDGADSEWELELGDGRDSLRGYEEVLLDELGVRTGPEIYPNLTKRSSAKVAAVLRTEVARRGWFTDDPARTQTAAYLAAGAGVLVGVLVTVSLAMLTTWAAVGLGLVLGSLLALTVARRSAVLTSEGQHLAAQALAVQRGLTQHARDIDARYFPYAVALGVSTKFAKSLAARGVAIPGWVTANGTDPITWTSMDTLALQGSRFGPSAATAVAADFPPVNLS